MQALAFLHSSSKIQINWGVGGVGVGGWEQTPDYILTSLELSTEQRSGAWYTTPAMM